MAVPADMPLRVADALAELADSERRLAASDRLMSMMAVRKSQALIRDLARLAGVDLTQPEKVS